MNIKPITVRVDTSREYHGWADRLMAHIINIEVKPAFKGGAFDPRTDQYRV